MEAPVERQHEERRLATVRAADIVGDSRPIAADEAVAFVYATGRRHHDQKHGFVRSSVDAGLPRHPLYDRDPKSPGLRKGSTDDGDW